MQTTARETTLIVSGTSSLFHPVKLIPLSLVSYDSLIHMPVAPSSSVDSTLPSFIHVISSLFHSRLKNCLFHRSFPPCTSFLPRDWLRRLFDSITQTFASELYRFLFLASFYSARSYRLQPNIVHFGTRSDDVHAFGHNSAESERIWMKSGTLWVHCLGLTW